MVKILTSRQREILRLMRDEDQELVYERGVGCVGDERVAPRTVVALLRLCALRHDPYSAKCGSGGLEIYHINQTGKRLIEEE